ncbi:MAG TPA: hypothetical protein VK541_23630 [Pedobacter sp.]|uniref:putative sensor domain DACNV-containing protein n=1 Tax=Pedobacter sp. TaxID=1411316 RepID=UPI002BFFE611|nr:hypothetical protein [Pedobacter sp.]HMI05500.1 hypothetical protein [Pedobacter sp.]
MVKHFTPEDLASFVHTELQRSKIKEVKPSESILKELFNTLYYTSLQTEEGQFIKVTVTLFDHADFENKDLSKHDNPGFFAFDPKIEFSIKNLVKLSKAADPWSSSLSVYYDDSEKLFIYGMIDQTIHYQSYLNYEEEEKPLYPGIIQAMINGIGILNVMLDYHPIATLNQHSLVKLYPNVFEYGPVSEFISENAAYKKAFIEKKVGHSLTAEDAEIYNEIIFEYVIQAISRILLRIKNYSHGGAILITKNFNADLTTKYHLEYDRIQSAILHTLTSVTDNDLLLNEIKSYKKKAKDIPAVLHDEYKENELDIDNSYNEMIGAVRFVSSLSCVDGLVLMSPHLEVKGFGAVINEKELPEYIAVSKSSKPSAQRLKIDPKHFGTRHQSMFSYCLKHPDSLGFVVSQDGEIRAIKNVEGEVMMWENIKVYQFERSNKIPKLPPRK